MIGIESSSVEVVGLQIHPLLPSIWKGYVHVCGMLYSTWSSDVFAYLSEVSPEFEIESQRVPWRMYGSALTAGRHTRRGYSVRSQQRCRSQVDHRICIAKKSASRDEEKRQRYHQECGGPLRLGRD